ncbi:hypothetical protein FQN57_004799 [Myotisia sp. PD_48]|nr:hypothetical protein FQN57_004799 [Myotisia sp. PD_48]
MEKQTFETIPRDQITDAMLTEAAKLFNENYGIWGEHSHSPGKPVKLSGRRLRAQYLPDPAGASCYIRVIADGNLVGNAFACRWKHDGKNICWITQLVVDRNYRECGLASGLLRLLRSHGDDIYGIMSSHPAACMAAASSFGKGIGQVDFDLIEGSANAIMEASPISYIREARLRGTLFDSKDSTGLVCGVNTGFFVDHEEPLKALNIVRQNWHWPLGDLPHGHEYLLVLPGKQCRSRSSSAYNPKTVLD